MEELTVEQLAEQQLKVDAQAKLDTETKAVNKTEALRELSKELGINAFEPAELKAKFNDFTTWQNAQKTEQEKLQETVKTLTEQNSMFTTKEQGYQTKIEALGLGFSTEQLDEVLALAKVNIKEGQTIADGLKIVKEKYGNVFVTKNIGIQHNDLKGDKLNIAKTEQEKYLAGDPTVQAYLKKQGKLAN